jgi:ribosomal protection tetracycline resistance protein
MAISLYAWRQFLNIINLGILAHVDAGKTTVTESLLHTAGAVRLLGRVDHGNTVTDSLRIERERGITVRAATVSLRYKNVKINILDTPGHVDFIAEVERSLAVLDAAVLVLSAREGVQSQTAVLFRALQKLHIPTFFFINKLDRLGANADAVLSQIRTQLTDAVLLRQKITGIGKDVSVETLPLESCEGVVDQLFQADDGIANLYLSDKAIPSDMLWDAYLRAVKNCAVYPVYAGVALTELGIPALLDAITAELPQAERSGDSLCALVYKLEFHERYGRICYLRMYGGAIVIRRMVALYGTNELFRITLLFTPDMGELKGTDAVICGDIAVIPCYEGLKVGSILGQALPPARDLNIAEPLLLTRVCAGNDIPRSKLLDVLHHLCMEDPLLNMSKNEQTGALELRVFGQVQMEILREMAFERFGLHITLEEPQTIFREFPARLGSGNVQWGETPFQAAIGITIEPLKQGSGIQYETKVNYGYLYASYQNAVREGLINTLCRGIYGWEVTDLKITLQWAEYSSVTSTPADYRNIAPVAVIRALRDSGTELLEPMLSYTLTVPADMAGRASYDLNMMHATLDHMTAQGNEITYSGQVSLDTSKLYSQAVAAYTKGTGVFTVRQNGYALFTGDKETVSNKGCEIPSAEKYLLMKSGRMV